MIIDDKVNQLENLLLQRAKAKKVIKYPEIYSIFNKSVPRNDVWDTFEEACRNIASSDDAIFGALMSNKDEIPESGFFDIYQNKRYDKYQKLSNGKHILDLSLNEKKLITEDERATVFDYASNI